MQQVSTAGQGWCVLPIFVAAGYFSTFIRLLPLDPQSRKWNLYEIERLVRVVVKARPSIRALPHTEEVIGRQALGRLVQAASYIHTTISVGTHDSKWIRQVHKTPFLQALTSLFKSAFSTCYVELVVYVKKLPS